MNKSGLVDSIADKAELTKTDAAKALDAAVDCIANALQQGDSVAIVGFGTFSVSHRPARVGRNPQTGESIQISATNVPKFKAGKALKDAVN